MSVHRFAPVRAPLVVAAFALLAACGPSDVVGKDTLDPIEEGMTLEAVAGVLGTGPLTVNQPADSLRLYHGFRTQLFLVNGQNYRVLWYRKAPGELEDQITRESDTPILFDREDRVIARGWSEFDDKAADLGIPNPYRAAERLDSISKSQLPRP